MLDTDQWIKEALAAAGIDPPMSREPIRTAETGRPWLTWRKTSTNQTFASGVLFKRQHNLTLTLSCQETQDHQRLAQDVVDALGAKPGCVYARVAGDSWDATIQRREVFIFLGIREVMEWPCCPGTRSLLRS